MSLSCKESAPDPVSEKSSSNVNQVAQKVVVKRFFVKDPKNGLALTVRIYDAKAMGLGEFYTAKSELKDAELLAEFTVINEHFEESVIKNESENYYLVSKVLLSETGIFAEVDLSLDYKGQGIQTKTLIKFGKYQLMEVSNPADMSRVFVYEISLEKAQK